MDYDNGFILQKTVDWSLLNDGMTIPISACAPIACITRLQNNESTNIIIISSITTGLSIRTIRTSIVRSSSSSLRMARF